MRKPWTEEEVHFLKCNFPDLSYDEIAKKLNRTEMSIKGKIARMGLKSGYYWTSEEVSYLINNYQNKTYKELSKILNRPSDAIKKKAYSLKLPDKVRGLNLIGKKFGKLTVISKLNERNEKGSIFWMCNCTCGNDVKVPTSQLTAGKTSSCGCIRENMKGENHPSYNPLLTEKDRRRKRYIVGGESTRKLRENVFKRDSYTCVLCNKIGGDMNAHHLNGWDNFKEQRFDLDNLVTLCTSCHSGFHKTYGYGGNTREQFEEYSNTRKGVV